MRVTDRSVVHTVVAELSDADVAAFTVSRKVLRSFLKANSEELSQTDYKAIEDSIYLISTVLGNHE